MPRCLETRRTPEGFKRRRYDDKTSTIEVPLDLFNTLRVSAGGPHGKRDRVKQWLAARKFEAERGALKQRAFELFAAGWKTLAVSSEIDVPWRTVCTWKTQWKALKDGNES